MAKFTINPVSTGNQPLSAEITFDGVKVTSAKIGIMGYWDFEALLIGKHPLDALQAALRMNSHLSVAHGLAAARALEEAAGTKLTFNGMLARNILQACEFIYYHLYHFYQGVVFTFTPGPGGGTIPGKSRLTFQQNGQLTESYWAAISIRTKIHEMMALLAGKVPHGISVVPGGISEHIETRKIVKLLSYLSEIGNFVKENYINDVRTLTRTYSEWSGEALGDTGYLSVGGFARKILKSGREDNFYFSSSAIIKGATGPVEPNQVELDDSFSMQSKNGKIEFNKGQAYSWIKAGRFAGSVVETGALARHVINGRQDFTEPANPRSLLGRELVRAYECIDLVTQVQSWIDNLTPGDPMNSGVLVVPEEGKGTGMAESPAGPVIHQAIYSNGVIREYHIIDPVVFNFSPQDARGRGGPAEQALLGLMVSDPRKPIEVVRVIRAFE